MKKLILFTLLLGLVSQGARAECYYAYKAKKENPLQLHYGIIRVDQSCSVPVNRSEIANRIVAGGWTLLVVLEPVSPDQLSTKKDEAGEFFLRY